MDGTDSRETCHWYLSCSDEEQTKHDIQTTGWSLLTEREREGSGVQAKGGGTKQKPVYRCGTRGSEPVWQRHMDVNNADRRVTLTY